MILEPVKLYEVVCYPLWNKYYFQLLYFFNLTFQSQFLGFTFRVHKSPNIQYCVRLYFYVTAFCLFIGMTDNSLLFQLFGVSCSNGRIMFVF